MSEYLPRSWVHTGIKGAIERDWPLPSFLRIVGTVH